MNGQLERTPATDFGKMEPHVPLYSFLAVTVVSHKGIPGYAHNDVTIVTKLKRLTPAFLVCGEV